MKKHFLEMKQEVFTISSPLTIFEDLNKTLSNWTWEITSDTEYLDTHVHAIGLTVYIPGRILYSYFLTTQQELQSDIRKAIFSSCEKFASVNNQTPIQNQQIMEEPIVNDNPNPVAESKPQSNEIAPDIMAMIEANQQKVQPQQTQQSNNAETLDDMFDALEKEEPKDNIIRTMEQLQNDPREQIPFDEIDPKVASMMHTGITEDVPEDPKKFTPRQIAAMKELKEKLHEIDATEDVEAVLARFINTWNPKFSSKKDLTNRNVDDFISYSNRILSSMGK